MICIVLVDARLDVNVALNRPSYLSSTYVDPWGRFTVKPGDANDGDHSTEIILVPGSCIHTVSELNPWWGVDLSVALYVFGVNFTNRAQAGM